MPVACAVSPHFTGTALPPSPAPNFTLTSDIGRSWTLAAQRGEVVALLFGFTHCTDTCPDTLARLSHALQRDHATAKTAEIAFVTVDPLRDRPAVMRKWIRQFSGAKIVGLTGSQAQIDRVEHLYHVWSKKIPGKRGSDDYDEEHSAFTFLIDRSGDERVVHSDDDSLRDFAADLRTLLQ
ncbi:MAG TPA: SCO family protein [Candidatus Baltobacteraceae bacterium]|nr:SCO family protein [Candidatus Baltobacteraceae bacterium]